MEQVSNEYPQTKTKDNLTGQTQRTINQSISSPMNKSISQEWRKAQLFVKDYGFHLILKASIFCIPSAKTFELN